MAAIDFPGSPTIGDEFSSGQSIWKWDGLRWNLKGSYGVTGPVGPQGPAGPQGAPSFITGPTGAANVYVSPSPPGSPYTGLRWFDSNEGRSFTYYDGFWVEQGAVRIYPDAEAINNNLLMNIYGHTTALDTLPMGWNDVTDMDTSAGLSHFAVVTPLKNYTINHMMMWGSDGGNPGASSNRMVIYHMTSLTTGTAVAKTYNLPNLFSNVNPAGTRYPQYLTYEDGFPQSYTLLAGERYAVGAVLYDAPATSYNIAGVPSYTPENIQFDVASGIVTCGTVAAEDPGLITPASTITLGPTRSDYRPFVRMLWL